MTSLLVDGNNLLMRAIFATQHSGMNADGVPTGPLAVFINTLTKHIREERPTKIGVAWDGGKSTERLKLHAEYKGNRIAAPDADVKQSSFALAKEFLALATIYQTELPGHEADDVIAAWWAHDVSERPPNRGIRILSSDKDFVQLLGPNKVGVPTELIRLSSADTPTDRWTAQRLRDEHGYGPEMWPLVTALTGDKSDNVIGVPRVGPKTAVKLLSAYGWDLESALGDAKLAEHADRVRTNLRLVNLREPRLELPPPPRLRPTCPGDMLHPELLAFFERYRLQSARQRYLGGSLWAERPGDALPGRSLAAPRP